MTTCVSGGTRLVLAVALLVLPLTARAEPTVRSYQGVSYVSGGVSDDEARALEATGAKFDLKLTMALSSGHFVADTPVEIQDGKGQTVLEAVADGPVLFAQLPPGTYTVRCSLNGKPQQQTAHISTGKQERLAFTWKAE